MMPFPALTMLFVQKHSCLYNKKITRCLEDMNLFSCGKKQYFTHLLRSFVKYCFHYSKLKFISSHRRIISSMYLLSSISSLAATLNCEDTGSVVQLHYL